MTAPRVIVRYKKATQTVCGVIVPHTDTDARFSQASVPSGEAMLVMTWANYVNNFAATLAGLGIAGT